MRLTLVISSLGRGGAERALCLLAGAWADQGEEVTVLRLDHGEAPAYPIRASVKLNSLGLLAESHNPFQSIWRNFSRIRILRRAISDSQPDLVISFMDRTNVRTLLATRGLGYPVAVCEQTDPALFEIGRIWKLLRRAVYPFADTLVCPMRESLAKFQAMTRVRGVVIPNPIAAPPGSAGPVRPPQDSSGEHVLLAMGRLVPQKGFDLLLSAFATLASRHPRWRLDVLGEGPLLGELQKQAESLNLKGRVHFCGAVADPFSRLFAADLFVFSSRFEGFGMALAEAMACGLPVVSFDCPEGPADIIRDGVDGVLVPAEDVGALAAALDRLMSDPQERQRLAARAPEVRQRFSTERVLTLWQEVFDDLVE
jgi:glycosyltransferase involved in cell wall biosynthesis